MMSMENKQTKVVNDVTNTKNKQNEQQQQKNKQHVNEQPAQTERFTERKLIVDSNYNLNIKNNMNGLNKHKDNDNKLTNSCDNNNSRKFAFLAQQTIPDYRPQQVRFIKEKQSSLAFYINILFFYIPIVDRKMSKNFNKSEH